MLEDDIQYIGTRNVPVVASPFPLRPFSNQQGTATGKDRRRKALFDRIPNEHGPSGIVLHVEANGGQAAHDIMLRKSQTSSATIGRKSSSDNRIGGSDEDPGNIGFHCQVVSSKHAKLAFTDSGAVSPSVDSVQISADRHMTHLQVYLIDLGSRHGTHLRRPGDIVSKQLEPEMPNILRDGDVVTFGKSVGKGSYLVPPVTSRVELLFDPHVSGASALPSNILDAPQSSFTSKVYKPSTNRYGLVPSLSSAGSSSPSSDDDGSSRYDHDSDVEEIPPASFNAERMHNAHPSSVVLPALKAIQAQLLGSALGIDEYPAPLLDNVQLPAIEKAFSISRSHSPMELSSSSPSPANITLQAELSPSSFFKPYEVEEPFSHHDSENSSNDGVEEGEVINEEPSAPLFSEESFGPTSEPNHSFDQESRSPSPPSEFDLQGREKETHAKMAEVNETISRMKVSGLHLDLLAQITHSFIQSGLAAVAAQGSRSANLSGGGQLLDLEDRVADAESMSSNLDDRLDVTEDHVFDLQQHVTKLQEQADSLTPMLRDSAAETLAEVKAGVASLRDLMARKFASALRESACADVCPFPEMSSLHEEMEKQMAAKLASVEEARLAFVAATSETQTASKKRRRSDIEDEEALSTDSDKAILHTHDCIHPPARKRARRIVSSVMHTATAVTIGAVATWTALAFS